MFETISNLEKKEMQKFAIARKCKRKEYIHSDPAEWGYEEYIAYLRIEPNGNLFWSIHLEQATQFEHIDVEYKLRTSSQFIDWNCYLVPAAKTDA